VIWSGLWHYCLTVRGPLLDRTRPVSVLDGYSISSSDHTLVSTWPDMQVALSTVNPARVYNRTWLTTDRTWLQCVRSTVKVEQRGSREGFERPDASSHPWSDSTMRPFIQRVWIWSRPLPSTRRVRSHRPMRPVSTKNVELAHNGWNWVRGYKYIPYSSIWGLLLICSAEKHLSCARECKSLVRRLWFENQD
jgi:hypothetical protein